MNTSRFNSRHTSYTQPPFVVVIFSEDNGVKSTSINITMFVLIIASLVLGRALFVFPCLHAEGASVCWLSSLDVADSGLICL